MRDALAVTCGDVSRHVTDVWTFCRICASTVSSSFGTVVTRVVTRINIDREIIGTIAICV